MRLVPTTVAVTVLAATFVVAPTMSSGAKPRPVAPTVREVGIPAVAGSGAPAARARTAAPTVGDPVVAATRVDGVDFDVAGVTFDRTPPTGTRVEVRTHDASGWSGWVDLDLEEDDAPDPGSADARHARPGTAPLAAAGSDAADIRVTTPDGSVPPGLRASLVDGGDSPADTAIDPPAGSAVAAVARPTIISRAQWGADESIRTCDGERLSGFKAVVVHHTVNSNTYSADQVPALLRSMYAFHVKSRGWCDLGYQILVDRFGRAYEGRKGSTAAFVMGAQAGGFNAETTGISVIGDFTSTPMSSAAQSTVTRVAAWEGDRSLFDPSSSVVLTSAGGTRYKAGVRVTKTRVVGHRDLSLTSCPGDRAYPQVASIRSGAGSIWRAGQWSVQKPKTVAETYSRPASGSFDLSGRGFGHGVGLSQWGAYGAATRGLTWQQTLAFYYPGTTRTANGNPSVRVLLQSVGTGATELVTQSGNQVSNGSRSSTLSTAYRWRVVPEGSGVSLQAWHSGRWNAVNGWTRSTAPLTLSRPSTGTVRLVLANGTQREFRGTVRVVPVSGRAYPVNVVFTESYLRGVVPNEMPASWPAAALAAQSVAARTYVAYGRSSAGSRAYDTCDTTCQAYRGVADYTAQGVRTRSNEDSRATAAVNATVGVIVSYGGKPALAQYSSSNGGRTVRGSAPYLVAKADPYDGAVASPSNPSTWQATLTAAAVESRYPAIGTLRSIAVGPRTGGGGTGTFGGRVGTVTLSGSAGSATVSGDAFRSALGLRSTWWTVSSAAPRSAAYSPRDVTGDALGDVIIPSGAALKTLSYTGSKTFTTRQIVGSGFSGMRAAAAVGPFDNDNLGDVVAIDPSGNAWLYRGLGASNLNAGRVLLAAGWGQVTMIVPTGDWNGDGLTDFATRMSDGRLILRTGNGTGRITSSPTIGTGWNGLSQVTSGEYDGDGKRDLVAVRSSDGALVLYAGNGTGGFKPGRLIGASGWTAMSAVRGIGDITGDGRDDLLTRRKSDGALLVYRVVGAARLTTPLSAGASSSTLTWGQ
ncbi:SpoIID/LytB domain-containing protein [Intrasporangium sp. YIM S08009]|uniref:SpoIID/LytB domain-containing protein n=1 Tax=Intrasporangium zincisolvens TaxID=3080018 RepID=UPI002B057147|nr:SpoIID/LytB domain-containing protein [Intrasporangium sp. YIM S08009]